MTNERLTKRAFLQAGSAAGARGIDSRCRAQASVAGSGAVTPKARPLDCSRHVSASARAFGLRPRAAALSDSARDRLIRCPGGNGPQLGSRFPSMSAHRISVWRLSAIARHLPGVGARASAGGSYDRLRRSLAASLSRAPRLRGESALGPVRRIVLYGCTSPRGLRTQSDGISCRRVAMGDLADFGAKRRPAGARRSASWDIVDLCVRGAAPGT
jgi:hypothetical protein